MRYFLDISYNGRNYKGWQIQKTGHSVQAEIQQALQTILQEDIEITGSGRTDAGVHAIQQFAHFDTHKTLTASVHHYKLNKILPADISINNIYLVPDNLHARFDAQKRSYVYKIHATKNPFNIGLSWEIFQCIDKNILLDCASIIKQQNDFRSFCKAHGNQKTTLCTLFDSHWEFGENEYYYHIQANRFLRGMVRGLVGTMIETARGLYSIDEFEKMFGYKDRTKAGGQAPPHGLYLSSVLYPNMDNWKKIE